jgi:hypothetical protein
MGENPDEGLRRKKQIDFFNSRLLASLARQAQTDAETLMPERHWDFARAGRPGKNDFFVCALSACVCG